MITDGQIAIVLYLLHPMTSAVWLLMCIAQVVEPAYRGYYVLAMAIFGIISRFLEIGGKRA